MAKGFGKVLGVENLGHGASFLDWRVHDLTGNCRGYLGRVSLSLVGATGVSIVTGFYRNWMVIWCNAVIATALVFVLAAFPTTDIGTRLFYDLIYWPLDGQSGFSDEARPSIAVLGAVFLAFAVLLRSVILLALDNPISPLWRIATLAMVVWWVVDSGVSVFTGIPVNAVTNTVLLVTFLVPVLGSGVLRQER